MKILYIFLYLQNWYSVICKKAKWNNFPEEVLIMCEPPQ